jgi:hypothetical protein
MAWRGSARVATMTPSQGKTPMTHRQGIVQHQHMTSSRGSRAAPGEARGRHGRNPRCGRRRSQGHGEAIGKISWTGRCAIARSTRCAPSRRLTPAGVVRIEGTTAVASQSRELKREEEKGAR